MDKQRLVEKLEQELYLKETGYTTMIVVHPRGTQNGLSYDACVVEVVVLDDDGSKIAYRYSDDGIDEDWTIGYIEDAVRTAIDYYEQALEVQKEIDCGLN